MLSNIVVKTCKATIIDLIVALLVTVVIVGSIYLLFGQEVNETFSIVSKVSIDVENKKEAQPITISDDNKLQNYPEYGTQYATLEIPRLNLNVPVYFGDTLEILKKGVGHSSGSYFPGEGGSIVYMGHNSKNMFRRFSELQVGDQMTVTTSYGKYTYEIYEMLLINETEVDKLPIQREKEILMVYTCYPFNNIGYATQRYVVYAELVSEE